MSKTVFVTGASSGIGKACAMKFAENGYRVIMNSRNRSSLEAVAEEMAAKWGTQSYILPFDVRNREETIQAIASIPADWKEIDVLVNNAGLALGLEKQFEADLDDYETMVTTNILGLLTVTHEVVPGMKERGRGHVINIGSVAGDVAYAGGSAYCASKAAVKILSDGLRIDLADTPIRVTNIKPGLVETNFSVVRFKGDQQKADNVYKGIKPLTGDDIADVVYYAASAPAHVQIAEVLVLATHQASGTVVYRDSQ